MSSISKIRSWKALCCFALLYAGCITTLLYIQQLMSAAAVDNGYKGKKEDLMVFDLRMGYTSKQAQQLINNWGPLGCKLYILCEALDYAALMPGYGGVLLVLMNLLGPLAARKTGFGALRHTYTWVVTVLAVDALENAVQLALVVAYLCQPASLLKQWWIRTAVVASAVNQTKWWIARCGSALALLLTAAVLSPRDIKPKRPKQVKEH